MDSENKISHTLVDRRMQNMIYVRMAEALYNPKVLTDKYFTDFCRMLRSLEEIKSDIFAAIEKEIEIPTGAFALWCDGSSLPPEGILRINMTIAILKELEYRLLPAK